MTVEAPWRDRVEQAVADRLATIVAGDTYLQTPALVTRSLVPDAREYDNNEELGQGAVIGVVRRSGSTSEVDGQDTRDNEHRFMVMIFVKGELRGAPEKVASRLGLYALCDTIVCLRSDPTLGGVVADLDLDGPTDNDEGTLEPYALFSQPWVASAPGDDEEGV
jgi:hypothetical protein